MHSETLFRATPFAGWECGCQRMIPATPPRQHGPSRPRKNFRGFRFAFSCRWQNDAKALQPRPRRDASRAYAAIVRGKRRVLRQKQALNKEQPASAGRLLSINVNTAGRLNLIDFFSGLTIELFGRKKGSHMFVLRSIHLPKNNPCGQCGNTITTPAWTEIDHNRIHFIWPVRLSVPKHCDLQRRI